MDKANHLRTLEMLPVLGFGLAYWRYDLQTATAVLMTLMTLFVVYAWIRKLKLNTLQLSTWIIIMVLGSATLLSQDDLFIKWKTTIINSILGLVFLGSHFLGTKTFVEKLLGEKIKAPRALLRRFNGTTGIYFIAIAILNLYIAETFDTTTWVNFKLFGIFILNVLYFGIWIYVFRNYLSDLMKQN